MNKNQSDSLVTIIIPTYNSAHFVTQAIESSLQQSHSNIEVLVIDDGSTDDTYAVIKKYLKDNRLKYFYHSNHERSYTRNRGLDLAQGAYIQFLDADDYLDKDKIQLQIKSINKDNLDASFSKTYYIKDNRIIKKRSVKIKKKFIKNLILGNKLAINCVLFRKDNTRFDECKKYLEDWKFWITYLPGKKVDYCGKAKCFVRIHEGNTSLDSKEMRKGELVILEELKMDDYRIFIKKFEIYLFLKKINKAIIFLKLAVKSNIKSIFLIIKILLKYFIKIWIQNIIEKS